jgi:hypothetical protein
MRFMTTQRVRHFPAQEHENVISKRDTVKWILSSNEQTMHQLYIGGTHRAAFVGVTG